MLWSRAIAENSLCVGKPCLGLLSLSSPRSTELNWTELNWDDKYSTGLWLGLKAGCVRLCRLAGNTVWSHMANDIAVAVICGSISRYTWPLTFDLLQFTCTFRILCRWHGTACRYKPPNGTSRVWAWSRVGQESATGQRQLLSSS